MAEGDPKFIKYLLNPKEKYEFYYIVGNGKNNTPVERIGVVIKMLIAHSPVFKRELEDEKWKDQNDTKILDIFPSTFKHLLRYIYGYNNIASLSFDEADDLIYAADKYFMDDLKQLLATKLMELVTYENVCCLMNNPAVYRVYELNNQITKIIQYETNKVLACPQFLGLCEDAFLKILEQDQLQAAEIELWRSAVKWAKSRVSSEDGPTLRKELVKPLQHIRLCTLSHEDFCHDVVRSKILTDAEIIQVCMYHGDKNTKPELKDICDTIETRVVKPKYKKSQLIQVSLSSSHYSHRCISTINITTKGILLELTSLVLRPSYTGFLYNITIKVEQLNSTTEPKTIVRSGLQASSNSEFVVPVSGDCDDEAVHLLPKSNYDITITSNGELYEWYTQNSFRYSGKDFDIDYYDYNYDDDTGDYTTIVKRIDYNTLT